MTAPRSALLCILDGWGPGGGSRPSNKSQPRREVLL
jgi:hypothetical protein